LEDCIQRALATSPRLGEAVARVQESGAAVEEARVLGRPDFRLTAQYGHNDPGFVLNSPLGKLNLIPEDSYQVAATLRQPLWTGGRLTHAVKASQAAQAASKENYQRAAHDLRTDVRVAFHDVILAEELVRVAQEQLTLQQEQLQLAKARYQGGTVARFNVLSAEAQLSAAQQRIIEAQKARSLVADSLLSLVGLAPGQDLTLIAPDLPKRPEGSVEECIDRAVERRPELRQLDLSIRAEESKRDLERSSNAPRLDLQAQQIQQTHSAFNLGTQTVVGAILTIPLYDGGLASSRAEQANCRVKQLREQREEARRNVVLQVRHAYTDLSNAYDRLEVAERNVRQAREAMRAARCRYEYGLSLLVELQASQTDLVDALVSQSQTRYQCQVATAQWLRATADPTLETTLKEVHHP
jgi:OMF family outer membrane factor